MAKISGSEEFLRVAKFQVLQMAKEGLDPTDNVKYQWIMCMSYLIHLFLEIRKR